MLRELKSSLLNQMIIVQGIIVNASKTFFKARKLVIICRDCSQKQILEVTKGLGGVQIPRMCVASKGQTAVNKTQCRNDPYVIAAEESAMID